MRLSVVIPYYYGLEGKLELLTRAIESLRGHNELIVIGHDSKSLPWALNAGMDAAHGDFILIMSDDMYLMSGTLASLCLHSYVTHPRVFPLGGSMCFPRWIAKQVRYDENYKQGYFDDDDMFAQIDRLGVDRVVVDNVVVAHPHPGTTLERTAMPYMTENRRYYEDKWGQPAPEWPEPRVV